MTDQIPNGRAEGIPPQSVPPPLPQLPASPSAYAIAAFVLGIVSFGVCCAGIPALVLGLIELRNIRNRVSPVEGKSFALIGAILGGISTVLMFLVALLYAAFGLFMVFFAHNVPK